MITLFATVLAICATNSQQNVKIDFPSINDVLKGAIDSANRRLEIASILAPGSKTPFQGIDDIIEKAAGSSREFTKSKKFVESREIFLGQKTEFAQGLKDLSQSLTAVYGNFSEYVKTFTQVCKLFDNYIKEFGDDKNSSLKDILMVFKFLKMFAEKVSATASDYNYDVSESKQLEKALSSQSQPTDTLLNNDDHFLYTLDDLNLDEDIQKSAKIFNVLEDLVKYKIETFVTTNKVSANHNIHQFQKLLLPIVQKIQTAWKSSSVEIESMKTLIQGFKIIFEKKFDEFKLHADTLLEELKSDFKEELNKNLNEMSNWASEILSKDIDKSKVKQSEYEVWEDIKNTIANINLVFNANMKDLLEASEFKWNELEKVVKKLATDAFEKNHSQNLLKTPPLTKVYLDFNIQAYPPKDNQMKYNVKQAECQVYLGHLPSYDKMDVLEKLQVSEGENKRLVTRPKKYIPIVPFLSDRMGTADYNKDIYARLVKDEVFQKKDGNNQAQPVVDYCVIIILDEYRMQLDLNLVGGHKLRLLI